MHVPRCMKTAKLMINDQHKAAASAAEDVVTGKTPASDPLTHSNAPPTYTHSTRI